MDASPLKRDIPRELLLMTLDELTPQLISIDCNMGLIAKCTCRDDTGTAVEDLYYNLIRNIRALSALSRTCRELHQLVTPLLYACPLPPTSKGEWLLARTLVTSPDLAQLVRILVPGHPNLVHNYEWRAVPSEVTAFYVGFRKASAIPLDSDGNQANSGHRLAMGALGINNYYYESDVEIIPVDLITCLCPNLEQLCLLDRYWPVIDHWVLWGDSTMFPKLKRVSVDMYGSFRNFEREEYLPLLRRTPNLESIFIRCDRDLQELEEVMPGLVLHNLKFFELGNIYGGEKTLNEILRIMPNIEQFLINSEVFETPWSGENGFTKLTPKRAALWIRKKTGQSIKLRKFTINYISPSNGWVSRCQGLIYHGNYDTVAEISLFLQQYRDELDEATQIFARLGIDLICTIPTNTDLLEAADVRPITY